MLTSEKMGIAKRRRTRTKIRSGNPKKKRGNLLKQKAKKAVVIDENLRSFWDKTKTTEENFKILGLAADPNAILSERDRVRREIVKEIGKAGGRKGIPDNLVELVDNRIAEIRATEELEKEKAKERAATLGQDVTASTKKKKKKGANNEALHPKKAVQGEFHGFACLLQLLLLV